MPHKRWVPIESNPEVLNEFAKRIGMADDKWAFCDVYGLDADLLSMVPRPVKAVLMLFPITPATEAAKEAEEAAILAAGQLVAPALWYSKQTVSNACGTVAMLHAFANNPDLAPTPGSFLARYFEKAKDMSPEERARFLEHPKEGEPDIEEAHQEASSLGQSGAPAEDEEVMLHFICFVHVDGNLYELDGRKFGAVNHGPSSADTLLEDTVKVVMKYIEATNSIQFNLMALAPAQM